MSRKIRGAIPYRILSGCSERLGLAPGRDKADSHLTLFKGEHSAAARREHFMNERKIFTYWFRPFLAFCGTMFYSHGPFCNLCLRGWDREAIISCIDHNTAYVQGKHRLRISRNSETCQLRLREWTF